MRKSPLPLGPGCPTERESNPLGDRLRNERKTELTNPGRAFEPFRPTVYQYLGTFSFLVGNYSLFLFSTIRLQSPEEGDVATGI